MAADSCHQEGLDVHKPSEGLTKRLGGRLPAYASLQNPIDMTANVIFDPKLIASVVNDAMDSGEYDATILCVNLMWRQGEALAEQLLSVAQSTQKTPAIAWIAGKREHMDKLNASDVPVFTDPIRCSKAVSQILLWNQANGAPIPERDFGQRVDQVISAETLDTHEGQEQLFDLYNIPRAPGKLVQTLDDARRAARDLGFPVAAKIVATGLAHKSEIGGVFLNISSHDELTRDYGQLERLSIEGKQGVLIQKMVTGDYELFAGAKHDDVFGPIIVFGLGGIYVEIIKDSVIRLAPFTDAEAKQMIQSAKFYPILAGARGKPPIDVDAVARILSRLSVLATKQPNAKSIDLNPIMVTSDGAIVADAKVST